MDKNKMINFDSLMVLLRYSAMTHLEVFSRAKRMLFGRTATIQMLSSSPYWML